MKEKKTGRIIIIVAFVIIICSSKLIWLFAEKFMDTTNYENRTLATRPALTLDSFGTFPEKYNDYFNDHLQFRKNLVALNSMIDYYVFDQSASKDVIKGEDGWLFYNETLEDYQLNNLYTEEELENIKNEVLATKEYFKEKGIEFVILICPNKNTIYGEFMPSDIEVYGEQSRVRQMVDYLQKNTDVPVIFPVEELLNAKKAHPELISYFKLDTHWNYMGGFWASEPLLKALGVKPIAFEDIDYYQTSDPAYSWSGYDEANMLGLTKLLDTDINYHISNETMETITYDGYVPNDQEAFDGLSRVHSGADDKRKVFFVRDSFGEGITPYIAASFSEIYSIHRSSLKRSQIEEEQPDIFIYEIVERKDFIGTFNYQKWPK